MAFTVCGDRAARFLHVVDFTVEQFLAENRHRRCVGLQVVFSLLLFCLRVRPSICSRQRSRNVVVVHFRVGLERFSFELREYICLLWLPTSRNKSWKLDLEFENPPTPPTPHHKEGGGPAHSPSQEGAGARVDIPFGGLGGRSQPCIIYSYQFCMSGSFTPFSPNRKNDFHDFLG